MNSDRPVRVLHIVDSLQGGGGERWVLDIVRLSAPERALHRVVTIDPDASAFVYGDRLRQTGAWSGAPGGGVSATPQRRLPGPVRDVTRRIPLAWKFRLSTAWVFSAVMPQALYHIWREYRRFRPDVVHAHIFYSFPAGLLLEAMTGRPLVYTVPSRFSHIAEHGFGWLLRLYPRFQRRVDLYLTGFPSELTAVGVPEQKVVGLVAAADMGKILAVKAEAPRHRAEIRRRLGVPADASLALSVGRLHPSKGHEYALRALPPLLERFPNLHWAALGEGPERARLTSLAHELGVQRHAHFVGFVEEPLPWYAAADIYLRTMVLEGDNLSSCEAMAIGLPVVGFDTGATETEHVNRAGHGILVPNRDPEALAAAVAEILGLPDRGESMGARGTAYCQAHYDTADFVGNLLTTYADLAARRRRRSRQPGSRATPQSV